ncbi:MAG TPA: patatin-like protein, partial [Candidatus Angelobacter sp.]|nr:patatin-like protein [Candidatus Angelobacter sp.]
MSKIESHEQEVRFALVLYGGVSLAVYINGVMQEMLQLVRSTSIPEAELTGSAKVYRKLGAMLGPERNIEIPGQGAPIKTKFKIDIISGTSAGGINGIFLAKALANGMDSLTQIQDLWFTEGDIQALLNDHDSYRDIPVNQPKETKSLLNSRRMYLKLLNAFDGMDAQNTGGAAPSLADEIDLFATTTDIEGVAVPIQLFDTVVYERRYRNAFHFRFIHDERNDFEQDNNPFLAFAARCTSSFPFAFEPMQLCSIDDILKSSTNYANKKYCFSGSTRWHKYFTNYLQGVINTAKPFPQRPFGDGGYLNNAPFSYAVDALLQRQAAVPVDRKLLYVEPSPSHPEEEATPREAPNAIENSLDALITIPGYQTIRNDLMRVLERNRQASKINKTLGEVENEIEQHEDKCELPAREEDWEEIRFLEDSCYRPYYRMRSAEVTDKIATMLARIYFIEEESAYFYALRSLVRAWRETEYHVVPGEAGSINRWQDFLRDFDLPYRVRRLRFILKKLDGLNNMRLPLEHPSRAAAERTLRFGLGKEARELPAGLKEVRAVVFHQYETLSKLLRRLLEPVLPEDKDTPEELRVQPPLDPAEAVREELPERSSVLPVLSQILGELEPTAGQKSETAVSVPGRLEQWFKQKKKEASRRPRLTTMATARKTNEPADLEALCDRNAANLFGGASELQQQLRQDLHDAGEELRKMLLSRLEPAFEELKKIFATPIGTLAARFFNCFDLFDSIQYPMAFNTDIGEAEIVQIVRVCPEDATALGPVDIEQRRAKLKGLVMAHFGAFLDQDWRVNDLLWGRLDAAERVITALLPWTDDNVLRVRKQ